MKNILKTLAIASLVGAASAHADIVAGDLLLGFRLNADTPSATDKILVVDLGQLSSFGAGSSVNLNGYLTAAYGSNWNSNGGLTFALMSSSSLSGGNITQNNLPFPTWISSAATAAGNSSDFTNLGTSRATSGTDRSVATVFGQIAGAFNNTLVGFSGDSTVIYGANAIAVSQNEADSIGNASYTWAYSIDNGQPQNQSLFLAGNALPYGDISQTVTSADNYIDLRALTNGSATTTLAGSFVLDSAGNFAAVPEPSTYGLLGAGALAGIAAVRRRRNKLVA